MNKVQNCFYSSFTPPKLINNLPTFLIDEFNHFVFICKIIHNEFLLNVSLIPFEESCHKALSLRTIQLSMLSNLLIEC